MCGQPAKNIAGLPVFRTLLEACCNAPGQRVHHTQQQAASMRWAPNAGDVLAAQLRGRRSRECTRALNSAAQNPWSWIPQVDMTWHGHHHSYQRTCPVNGERCEGHNADGSAKAPVNVVIGNAGAELCWNVAPETPSHFEVRNLGCCDRI